MNLEYFGQNQDSGLCAKKLGVIFFQPLLFTKKHGGIKVTPKIRDGPHHSGYFPIEPGS